MTAKLTIHQLRDGDDKVHKPLGTYTVRHLDTITIEDDRGGIFSIEVNLHADEPELDTWPICVAESCENPGRWEVDEGDAWSSITVAYCEEHVPEDRLDEAIDLGIPVSS